MDPLLSFDRTVELNAEWEESDVVTQEDFVRAILKHHVKGMGAGVFYIPEIDTARGDRKVDTETVEVTPLGKKRVSVKLKTVASAKNLVPVLNVPTNKEVMINIPSLKKGFSNIPSPRGG